MCRDYKVHRARGVDPKTAQGGGGCEWWSGNYEDEVEAERHPGSWPCDPRVIWRVFFMCVPGRPETKLIGDCELYIQ